MKIETVSILGIPVAKMTMAEVLDWIRIMVEQGKSRHVVTANAEIIHKANREPEFFRMINKADLITADGSGVIWAAKLLGNPLPERVTGIDLVQQLFNLAEAKGWKLYFLGAAPEVVEKAVLATLSKHPLLQIAGYRDGYYSQEEIQDVVENIAQSKPDILLVGMGAPRQEIFIQEHLSQLNATIAIGVGGSFDVLAGKVNRAPKWMQKAGLEWLYRLSKEPKRFWRMTALPRFVIKILGQKLFSKKRTRTSR
ncbi:MAG: WecB/TagA/CpsF family glycosyltransferase [Peptococcia bacterium]